MTPGRGSTQCKDSFWGLEEVCKILLLTRDRKTIYFGDIGRNANTIKEFFGCHITPCPPKANPVEHINDVVTGMGGDG
ncbi:hypothetical protein V8F44DRAFT_554207 [Aspergillus fumigatus]|jgi:hypothetical protein